MNRTWAVGPRPGPSTRHRVFCLPYAGGSATAYHRWSAHVPPWVHVCGVELPGRGLRSTEPFVLRFDDLVRHLADLVGGCDDLPFTLFGHSMGGLLAFEVTRELRARGARGPEHLVVSGAAAPTTPHRRARLALGDDADLAAELRALGGTPPEILADREIMDMAVRTLRADHTVLEDYRYRPDPPLAVPLLVLGGKDDPVAPPGSLPAWSRETSAGHTLRLLPGDHFFVHTAVERVLDAVTGCLTGTRTREQVPARG